MDAKDWKEGDTLRRKTPYRKGNSTAPHGELCRVKKVIPSISSEGAAIIIVVGNRTTGNPVGRIEKYYEWVSRGESV